MLKMPENKAFLLKGTLDFLILKALSLGPQHGYGVARWLEKSSRDLLSIEEGSNRRAKYYVITTKGRTQLEREASGWERLVEAVSLVLKVQGS
jgi:DNA-binding PadR family transcriptional regulator